MLFLLSWYFIKWGVIGVIFAGVITIIIEILILYILYPIYITIKLKYPSKFYWISPKKFYKIDKIINNFYEKQIEEKYIIKIEDISQLKKDLNNKVNELLEDKKSNFELNLDKISNIILGTIIVSLLNSYHLSLFKNEMKTEELTSRLFPNLGIYILILLFIYITRYIAKINKKNSSENELEKLYEIEEFLDKYEKREIIK